MTRFFFRARGGCCGGANLASEIILNIHHRSVCSIVYVVSTCSVRAASLQVRVLANLRDPAPFPSLNHHRGVHLILGIRTSPVISCTPSSMHKAAAWSRRGVKRRCISRTFPCGCLRFCNHAPTKSGSSSSLQTLHLQNSLPRIHRHHGAESVVFPFRPDADNGVRVAVDVRREYHSAS